MIDWIIWYLLITLLGWLAFPITYRLLPALKDRGYATSRALGLLLWGFAFWLLAVLGILPNRADGLLLTAALIGGLSVWAWRGLRPGELRTWLRTHTNALLTVEALFLLAFATWAWVRAANPEAVGTEKPMELAFINAILGSPTFPPHDPWLAGYAISYYYFGYVLIGMLAKLAGTPGAVAFNLGISLVFALSAVGVYGLVYNLLNARAEEEREPFQNETLEQEALASHSPRYTVAALLAPLFLLIVSNLEGFLHLLHHHGLFWQRTVEGAWVSPFWTWLDIKDLSAPPTLPPLTLTPDRFWWWWRASRVVQDYDLAGNAKEIIDEFPFFSYLLADAHPHVLAMPFAVLAMLLALNLYLGGARGLTGWPRVGLRRGDAPWLSAGLVMVGLPLCGVGLLRMGRLVRTLNSAAETPSTDGAASGLLLLVVGLLALGAAGWLLTSARQSANTDADEFLVFDASIRLRPTFLLLCTVALGGMAFLNTWDFPMYVALVAAAYALRRMQDQQHHYPQAAADFVRLGLVLGISGILLYLPFYLGFASQAGGIIPNLVYPTRGAHLWVMFAPLLIPILVYLYHLTRRSSARGELRRGFLLTGGLLLLLWLAALAFGALAQLLPLAGSALLASVGASDAAHLFTAAVQRRLLQPGGWLTLALLLAPALGLLAALPQRVGAAAVTEKPDLNRAEVFAVLLMVLGGLLALGPEFFYLRDLFGWRMNTIFKFYFQVWLIWSAAAAYAAVRLIEALRGARRWAFGGVLVALLAAALVYPFTSLPSKTNNFQPDIWTLDSTAYFARSAPDEQAAVEWLQAAPYGVIAEATPEGGGSYSEYARYATFTGKPGVLGWVGHENQWRGEHSATAVGARPADLQQLYCTRDWNAALDVLRRYNVRYVIVGNLERSAYAPGSAGCPSGLVEAKFQRNLPAGFQSGNVTVYVYTGEFDE